jgi:hypothetical protein
MGRTHRDLSCPSSKTEWSKQSGMATIPHVQLTFGKITGCLLSIILGWWLASKAGVHWDLCNSIFNINNECMLLDVKPTPQNTPENHVRNTTGIKQHSDRAWLEMIAVRLSNVILPQMMVHTRNGSVAICRNSTTRWVTLIWLAILHSNDMDGAEMYLPLTPPTVLQ